MLRTVATSSTGGNNQVIGLVGDTRWVTWFLACPCLGMSRNVLRDRLTILDEPTAEPCAPAHSSLRAHDIRWAAPHAKHKHVTKNFPIVCVGGSAGGDFHRQSHHACAKTQIIRGDIAAMEVRGGRVFTSANGFWHLPFELRWVPALSGHWLGRAWACRLTAELC